jgi:hypothetical protein
LTKRLTTGGWDWEITMNTDTATIEGLPAAEAAYLAACDAHRAAVSVCHLVMEFGASVSPNLGRPVESSALLAAGCDDGAVLIREYAPAVRVEADTLAARVEALSELYTVQQAAWQHGLAA